MEVLMQGEPDALPTERLTKFRVGVRPVFVADPRVDIVVENDEPCEVRDWEQSVRNVAVAMLEGLGKVHWTHADQLRVVGIHGNLSAMMLAHSFGAMCRPNVLAFGKHVVGDPGYVLRTCAPAKPLTANIPRCDPPATKLSEHRGEVRRAYVLADAVVNDSCELRFPTNVSTDGRAIVLTPRAMYDPDTLFMSRLFWILGWWFPELPLLMSREDGKYLVLGHAGIAGALSVGRVVEPRPSVN